MLKTASSDIFNFFCLGCMLQIDTCVIWDSTERSSVSRSKSRAVFLFGSEKANFYAPIDFFKPIAQVLNNRKLV